MQHQITEPSKLLTAQGELVQKGYATSLLLEYNRENVKQKYRLKEWDYYLIYNRQNGIALAVGSSPVVSLISVSFFDFDAKKETAKTVVVFGGIRMPVSSEAGDIVYRDGCVDLSFVHQNGNRILSIKMKNFAVGKELEASLVLSNEPKDSMVIATPFYRDRYAFYYNQKIIGMEAGGSLRFGTVSVDFSPAFSFGLLDWGRGVWPYQTTWYWSAAQGRIGRSVFRFNLGYGFGNTAAATENMLFFNGKASKLKDVTLIIPKKANGEYDYLKQWEIKSSDRRIEMVFDPITDRSVELSAIVLSTDQHQVFGKFTGYAVWDNGLRIPVEDFFGFAERVQNRW